jgi:hypothetical protein
MDPGLRRESVICGEGAMNDNWITRSFAGEADKLEMDYSFTRSFRRGSGGMDGRGYIHTL